jgi:hypothetical protein
MYTNRVRLAISYALVTGGARVKVEEGAKDAHASLMGLRHSKEEERGGLLRWRQQRPIWGKLT